MTKQFKLPDQREQAISYLKSLNIDKPMVAEIKPFRRNRTNAQHRLLFMWLSIIGQELGYETEEIHAVFKDKFLTGETVVFQGKGFYVTPTTTTLNTKEFTEYLDKIDRFASSELGIVLPHPEDCYFEAMNIRRR